MLLRKATFEDWKFLLDLRNDPETKKNSHNTEEVEEQGHKNWLRSVLSNKDRQLFIAEEGVPIGTIRADLDNNVYELSWTIAPQARGKGFGSQMVKMLAEKLVNVRAEIKKENYPSIKIAQKAGMKLQREENEILYFICTNQLLEKN